MTKQAPTVQEVAISLPAFVPPPLPEASLRVWGASRLEEEHGCWRAKRVRRCGVVRVERIASVIPGGSPVRWHPTESLHAGFAQLCRHLTVREQWTLAVGSGWVPAGRERVRAVTKEVSECSFKKPCHPVRPACDPSGNHCALLPKGRRGSRHVRHPPSIRGSRKAGGPGAAGCLAAGRDGRVGLPIATSFFLPCRTWSAHPLTAGRGRIRSKPASRGINAI
ncbi:UNVERIFIED_ORG: hypothetical protein M2435_003455 [Rhizobium sophorae]|nr:hypothetical protein [Rhizobium leguminosarum]MDH6660541.1 hypothetical protein [Rhizobium sophorae]